MKTRNGRFELDGLPSDVTGEIRGWLQLPDGSVFSYVEARETSFHRIVLDLRPLLIEGSFRLSGGAPVSMAPVELIGWRTKARTQTNANGEFQLTVSPEPYRQYALIVCGTVAGLFDAFKVDIPTEGRRVNLGTLHFSRQLNVAIEVNDRAGNPVPSVVAEFQLPGRSVMDRRFGSESGVVVVPYWSAMPEILIGAPGYAVLSVDPHRQPISVGLERQTSLTLHVTMGLISSGGRPELRLMPKETTEEAKPVDSTVWGRVSRGWVSKEDPSRIVFASKDHVEKRGDQRWSFTVPNIVPAVPFRFEVWYGGHTLVAEGEAMVPEGMHREIQVSPPIRRIEGRVRDPEGQPVPGALVHIGGHLLITRADGTFSRSNIRATHSRFQVEKRGYEGFVIPRFHFHEDPPPLDIELWPTRRTIDIVTRSGRPIDVDGLVTGAGHKGHRITQGRYVFDAVPLAPVRINARIGDLSFDRVLPPAHSWDEERMVVDDIGSVKLHVPIRDDAVVLVRAAAINLSRRLERTGEGSTCTFLLPAGVWDVTATLSRTDGSAPITRTWSSVQVCDDQVTEVRW